MIHKPEPIGEVYSPKPIVHNPGPESRAQVLDSSLFGEKNEFQRFILMYYRLTAENYEAEIGKN
jgi:hypothetical protein